MRRLDERRLTYSDVGATAGELPAGYHHVRRSRVIGHGEARFRAAADGLMQWKLHEGAGLTRVSGPSAVEVGTRVLLRFFGMPIPCEIVYVVDEPRRRGFGYGTLEGHPETGEESFLVVWNADDTVEVLIVAFSRPATWWLRAGAPISRLVQKLVTERYLRAL